MASGMTSTVTQELVGYSGESIINYTNPNIESWFGIHDFAKNGRLVFISDSAGHPRFRRTTLRGLVGWAPHWTFLCLSAVPETPGNSGGAAGSAHEGHGSAAALSKDHLDLCLKLGLPLAIVLTKSDLVNKESLKRVLSPIWAAVKGAGRAPRLIQSKEKFPEWARTVCDADVSTIRSVLSSVRDSGDFRATVPVILQSSVTGDGTGLMHALLRELPLPPKPLAHDYLGMVINQEQPETLFHIEDRYNRPASYATSGLTWQANVECVVSGYLRFGRLELGQTVTVGPFPIDEEVAEAAQLDDKTASPSRSSLPSSHASPRAPFSEVARSALKNVIPATCVQGEWRQVRIVSIRNLRMSVQSLEADQVGTLGLALAGSAYAAGEDSALRPLKPRRGMVVAVPNKYMTEHNLELQAAAVITAYFSDTAIRLLSAGTPVTIYIASVRAQARVAKIWSSPPVRPIAGVDDGKAGPAGHMDDDVFGLEPISDAANNSAEQGYCVRLELLFSREWVELGSKIVILEGASREGTVLDGFVGTVVKVSET
ncbi:gtp-binding protein [Ophiostoma piceae UAMH 11346]|uniref:Gtp-binding protein n=1 Tax=Ophiostoma piceae (strain UAMH 11346) TaxID=1262450 RepID=S3C7N9_OPHP1|nr:gtp-binding protein [Ophiostoma piceae UAMH 11346]